MSTQPYPNPQVLFYQQYESVNRDEIVGILLALFLGTFGIHHFYLRRTGLGILYCLLLLDRHSRRFSASSSASSCPAACASSMPSRPPASPHRWALPMPGWGQPVNVTVNMPPMPQAGWTSQPSPGFQSSQAGQAQDGQSSQPRQGFSVESSQARPGTLLACGRCRQRARLAVLLRVWVRALSAAPKRAYLAFTVRPEQSSDR